MNARQIERKGSHGREKEKEGQKKSCLPQEGKAASFRRGLGKGIEGLQGFQEAEEVQVLMPGREEEDFRSQERSGTIRCSYGRFRPTEHASRGEFGS